MSSAAPATGRHPTTATEESSVTAVLLRRSGRDLERHLAAAVDGSDVGVHQARVATRRLREALPVLLPGGKVRRKTGRRVRRITRALGAVRELDVAVRMLDEFARSAEMPRGAVEQVRVHLVAERDRRRAVMLSRLARLNAGKLKRRLDAAAAVAAGSGAAEWPRALRRRVAMRARRLRVAVHAAGQMYAPEQLHEVRIATKKLRYALELLTETGLADVTPQLAALRRVQNTLGELHDLQIIEGHVAAVQALPTPQRTSDETGLAELAGTLAERCRHLHARYIKQAPALAEVIAWCSAWRPVPHAAARPARAVRRRSAKAAAARHS